MKNITRTLLPFCFLMLVIGALVSCKSSAPLATVTTDKIEKTESVVLRDTVIPIKADSSSYKAVVAVDSTGRISISEVTHADAGKVVRSPKVSIKDNVLSVDCYAEAQKLIAKLKHKIVLVTQTTTRQVPVEVPADLTWFEQAQIYCGRLLLLLAFLFGVGIFLKYKNLI